MNLITIFMTIQGILYILLYGIDLLDKQEALFLSFRLSYPFNFIGILLGIFLLISAFGLFKKKHFAYISTAIIYSIFFLHHIVKIITSLFSNKIDYIILPVLLLLCAIYFSIVFYLTRRKTEFQK